MHYGLTKFYIGRVGRQSSKFLNMYIFDLNHIYIFNSKIDYWKLKGESVQQSVTFTHKILLFSKIPSIQSHFN
jgi:uncharacterized protein Usg